METRSNKINSYRTEIAVEVPVERWLNLLDQTFESYRKTVKLEGFRKGKVPLGLVKKLFGKAIEAEAIEEATKQFYREALDKENIYSIAPGEIKDLEYGNDKPFTFKAVVEVLPEIKVEELDKMKTYLDKIELAGEDVDAGIELLREENAIISSHKGAVEAGCIVLTDIQEVDRSGVPVLTHKWNDISLEIGKASFGVEVDEELKGKKQGDNVAISLPSGEKDERGNDKPIYYRFEVREVQKKELPELTDEFASSLNEHFKSVDDLRSKVMEMMTERANNRAKVKMFTRLVDFLVENNRVDVPPSMVETYLDRLLEDARKSNKDIDETKFRDAYRNSTIRNLKWYLLRKAIIEENKLHATEAEMEQDIQKMAEYSSGNLEALRAQFKLSRNRSRLIDDIEERKVLDLLENRAQISPKKTTYKDFIAQDR